MDAIGRKRWAIAEGYSPLQSAFTDRTGRTPAAELCGSADVFLADRRHSTGWTTVNYGGIRPHAAERATLTGCWQAPATHRAFPGSAPL